MSLSKTNEQSFPYIHGFDGLRAFAVLSVIAYHLKLPFTTGGFLGVTVFFVLSGFLITSLLAWEWEQTGTIHLKSFWIRRAKRLLPAMFLLLIALNVFIPVVRPALTANLHEDTLAAFFYYSNWHYIFRDLSYFESFGTASLLTHFWSLAIEEQFYIVWALVIFFLFKFVKSSKKVGLFIMAGAAFSALLMAVLYEPYTDPSRVYYGTDTRMFSLLIGASFAILFRNELLTKLGNKAGKWTFDIIGMIGLSVFLFMIVSINEYDPFVYQGGMALLSIAAALLILSLTMPSALIIQKIMTFNILKWIGIRSYGIYLWHYPIIVLMNEKVNTGGVNYVKAGFAIVLTFLLAALSYTFVEKPIRQGRFRFNKKNTVLIAGTVCLLIVSANQLHKLPSRQVTASSHEELHLQPLPKKVKEIVLLKEKTVAETTAKRKQTAIEAVKTKKMTAIGDSVLIIPAPLLKEKFPAMKVDAKVSRQMRDAFAIVKQLKNNNALGEMVIIELGTNGPFPEKIVTDLLALIGKERSVLFINVRVPRPWEATVNKSLADISKKHNNVTIIDWYAASANHNEYFAGDGVHLKPKGAEAFADMVEKAVYDAVMKQH